MSTNLQIDQLAHDVERLRRTANPASVFGATGHRFILNDPLSEAQIAAFEIRHSIRLPDDYRLFLSRVGNGGAGPYYGVFRLGEMDNSHGYERWAEGVYVGFLTQPFPHRAVWNDRIGEPDAALADTDEGRYEALLDAFEERYFDSALVNGAIPICHLGCALRQWLVITGPEAGTIWNDFRADGGGLAPLVTATRGRTSFYQWYRDWLDSALFAS